MEDVPYGRILREGWVVIVVLAVFGAGMGWLVTKMLPETYAATSTLLLRVDSTEASLFERNQFSLARIKSYPPLVDSPEVIDAVRDDLDLDDDEYPDRDIRRMVSAENTADTVLLVVRADAPTAQLATDIANSAATHLSELIGETENDEDDARYTVALDQVLPAVAPLAPISPQVTAITGLGGIAGLALGAIVAVYRTTTNRRLRTISDVRRSSGLPVIGQIPRRSRLRQDANSGAAVAYEEAAGNLVALAGGGVRTHVVVPATGDAMDDEAVTGMLEAQRLIGATACVVDTRESHVKGHGHTLNEVLEGEPISTGEETDAVFVADDPIPLEKLVSELPGIIAAMHEAFDVVVVVCDPGASALIEKLVGPGAGVIINVKHNSTSATDLVAVTTRLRVMGVRPVGVVMLHTGSRSLGSIAESWRISDRDPAQVLAGAGGSHARSD
jgi:capsular polysaccharide biosynthesis protein